MSFHTYLHTKQEEIEVEVGTGQDIFIHDSHQNRRSAVGQHRQDRVVRRRSSSRLRRRRCLEGATVSLIQLVHLDRIVIGLLVFGHCDGVRRRTGFLRTGKGVNNPVVYDLKKPVVGQ